MIFGLFKLILCVSLTTTLDLRPDNAQSGIAFIPFEIAKKFLNFSPNAVTAENEIMNSCCVITHSI